MGTAMIQSIIQGAGEEPYRYQCVEHGGHSLVIQATTLDAFEIGKSYYVADIDNTRNTNMQRLIFDSLTDNVSGDFNIYPKNVWRVPEELNTPGDTLHKSEGEHGFKYVEMKALILDEMFKKVVPGFRIDTVISKTGSHLILSIYGWASTVCEPENFEIGDSVVVMFWKQNWGNPHCVGWHGKPRLCEPCTGALNVVPQWIRVDSKVVNSFPGWSVESGGESTRETVPTVEIGGGIVSGGFIEKFTGVKHVEKLRFTEGDVTYYEISMQFKIGPKCLLKKVKKILQRGTIDLQKVDFSDATIIWEKGVSTSPVPPEKFTVRNVNPVETYRGLETDPVRLPIEGEPVEDRLRWQSPVSAFQTPSALGWPPGQCEVGPATISMQMPLTWIMAPEVPNKVLEKERLTITDNNISIRVEMDNGSTHEITIDFHKTNEKTSRHRFFLTFFDDVEVASGASGGDETSCIIFTYSAVGEQLKFTENLSPDIQFSVIGRTKDVFKQGGNTHEMATFETKADPLITFSKVYSSTDLDALHDMGIKTKGLQSWTLTFDINFLGEKQETTITKVKE